MKKKMKINKAYKFRIYPSKEQEILFGKTFGCVRFVYNYYLSMRKKAYEAEKKSVTYYDTAKDLVELKKELEFLKEVDSISLQQTLRHLDTAYQNFFSNDKTKYPKYKSKKHHHYSYSTVCINNNIKLGNGCIILPKLKSVKIKQHREIPEGFVIKSVTVSMTPSRKYYVSVLTEHEEEITPVEIENVVGLDFSMKALYVSSEGEYAEYPRYLRKAQAKLAKEQRRLSKCTKGSNNYKKQKLRIARIHEKISNQRKDFLHKKSRKIANAYDAVCIEDLNMKAMSQSLNFGKSVSDNGFGMFRMFLEYKLTEQGKQLVKISKWFASSKTCSRCGTLKDKLPLSERTYRCECGFVSDRDINAAINIRAEGMRMIGITDGYLTPVFTPMLVKEKALKYVV